MNKVKKAVIPAAGYGTRFLPVTKSLPKEMLPIVDRPTIEYIVDEAVESGIEEILIVISDNKKPVVEYFNTNYDLEAILEKNNMTNVLNMIRQIQSKVKVYFVNQPEQLGLGHAVSFAKDFVGNEPFALLLGDDVYVGKEKPALKQLIEAYEKTNHSIIGVLEVPLEDVNKYGICDPYTSDDLSKLKGVVEKPNVKDAPSRLAIGGRYLLSSNIFNYLHNQTKGTGGEIQLTDSILRMINDEDVYSLKVDAIRYDVGTKIGYLNANIDFALNRSDLKDELIKLLKEKKL